MTSANDSHRSYARRTQYSVFAAYVTAVTGALLGLFAAILSVVDPAGFASLRIVAAEATAPVGRGINWVGDAASGAPDAVGAWWMAGSQNRTLRAELATARRQVITAGGLAAENAELRRLLGIIRAGVRPVAVSQILSTTASSTRRHAVIDAGYGDGVRVGQPVRSADGLIGRTLAVGPSVSRVLLITDRQSVLPARRASDGLALLVSGRGDELLDVRPLNAAGNPLKVGDLLHSSGSGGLFQPRTPVGIIIRIVGDGALARPLSDPSSASALVIEPASNAGQDDAPPAPETATDGGT